VEKIEEFSRCGNFDRIFPVKNTFEKYVKYLKVQRPCNLLMFKWLKMKKKQKMMILKDFRVRKNMGERVEEIIKGK
jgi:hypothetical protein